MTQVKTAHLVMEVPPAQDFVASLYGWLQQEGSPLFCESFSAIKDGMNGFLEFVACHVPHAATTLDGEVIVDYRPLTNAFFEPVRKTRFEPGDEVGVASAGQISVSMGLPVALVFLKPAISYAARQLGPHRDTDIPSYCREGLFYLYEAWQTNSFPPAIETFASTDAVLHATLTFVVAHEASHLLFWVDKSTAESYHQVAFQAFDELVRDASALTEHQRSLACSGFCPAWLEEIAADILAYETCRQAWGANGRRDLLGPTLLCALAATFERFLEVNGLSANAGTHPPSMIRLMTFQRYLRGKLGVAAEEFQRTADWQMPLGFFSAFCRVLLGFERDQEEPVGRC